MSRVGELGGVSRMGESVVSELGLGLVRVRVEVSRVRVRDSG